MVRNAIFRNSAPPDWRHRRDTRRVRASKSPKRSILKKHIAPMDERDFFLEARAQRTAALNCPFCKSMNEYGLTWLVRKKRTNINLSQLDERDRAKFEKAQSYMVLLDDHVTCAEAGCRRHFEISGVKTMAFVTPEQLEEVRFGNENRREGGQRQQPRGGGGQREGYGYRGQENRGRQENRGVYENRGGQGRRTQPGNSQGGNSQGGNQQGNRRGNQQGGRSGSGAAPFSPSQWNDQQGPRGPRGKRSDPTGPGGGWR